MDVDLAIVGFGGAGLALVRALDRRLPPGEPGHRGLRIAVVDPQSAAPDRTWCYWDGGDQSLAGLPELATGSWDQLLIGSADGLVTSHELAPLRYVMLEGVNVLKDGQAAADRLGVVRIEHAVETLTETPDGVVIEVPGESIQARWAMDSRPAPAPRQSEGGWCQHFLGWNLRCATDQFDPRAVTLMDFRAPQPGEVLGAGEPGLAFGYVLPVSPRHALVEYTVFSRSLWPEEAYIRGLTRYLEETWGPEAAAAEVIGTERGVIPMSTADRPRRLSDRIFRIGTAGGATRPASGFTFATMHRQAWQIAGRLIADQAPLPPRPYPIRHRWFDAVLLRALESGDVDGTQVLARLFRSNPAHRVLRFLDGSTRPHEEMAVIGSLPAWPMLRAALRRGE